MKSSYNGQAVPSDGTPIEYTGGELQVPANPIIPFIEGDGTGRDIWKASQRVFDAAIEHEGPGRRRLGLLPCRCRNPGSVCGTPKAARMRNHGDARCVC